MFNMYFGFNNQFIKVMRTKPIFKKYPKNIFVLLVTGIKNLYVKHIPDVKMYFFR